jgi:hypothetical protein
MHLTTVEMKVNVPLYFHVPNPMRLRTLYQLFTQVGWSHSVSHSGGYETYISLYRQSNIDRPVISLNELSCLICLLFNRFFSQRYA